MSAALTGYINPSAEPTKPLTPFGLASTTPATPLSNNDQSNSSFGLDGDSGYRSWISLQLQAARVQVLGRTGDHLQPQRVVPISSSPYRTYPLRALFTLRAQGDELCSRYGVVPELSDLSARLLRS